jgi:phosphate starvation-inducible PhoH-like protein
MTEKIIYLNHIDPVLIYGINDIKLERIKNFFPKLKIVARGEIMKIAGDVSEVARFEEKINKVVEHFQKFNSLTEVQFEELFFNNSFEVSQAQENPDVIIYTTTGRQIKARNKTQKIMIEAAHENDLLFAIGPSGTGKTYMAIALAVRALKNREVRKIILTRPAVEAGEHLGFLPGDMKDKLDPYLQPLYDALHDMIPPKRLADYMEDNIIQIAPLAFMRGRTLDNAFVILDEAQNATVNQLKMFLTRMGANSKFVVTGDLTQIDLPNRRNSGLVHSQRILGGIHGIAIIKFEVADIVRHQLVKHIVQAYDKLQEEMQAENLAARIQREEMNSL